MNSYSEAIRHALNFLAEGVSDAGRHILYGCPGCPDDRGQPIAIVPSGLFTENQYGRPASLPPSRLSDIEGVPLLYGDPRVERARASGGGVRTVVHADIVASAHFLLCRYEELARRDVRDQHGRFPGRESLPFRAGFLHRAVVDEYAGLLRRWLRDLGVDAQEPPRRIRRIHLTHDVDAPWMWPTWRAAVAASFRRLQKSPKSSLEPILSRLGFQAGLDPHDCFDWILRQDGALRDALGADRVRVVFFLVAGGGGVHDGEDYIGSRRAGSLIVKLRRSGATLGLHSSYRAGSEPRRIAAERERMVRITGAACTTHRSHFLLSREPQDLTTLAESGITDDFTMGYADTAGFRLGTCRPVRWFDPTAMRETSLTLHPLTIMDCTLDRTSCLGLDHASARAVCIAILDQVRRHHGEAVMLWHNTELSEDAVRRGSYQRELYLELLAHLGDAA